jgi:hypothetical protein
VYELGAGAGAGLEYSARPGEFGLVWVLFTGFVEEDFIFPTLLDCLDAPSFFVAPVILLLFMLVVRTEQKI